PLTRRESWTGSGHHSGRSEHGKHWQNAADTLRYSRRIYQRPTTHCSSPSDNASTARTRVQFPKSCRPADNRESAEKLYRPIARQSSPKVAPIPRPPLSSRTSFIEWLGPESNRRHVDFQSTALPTELPSRESRQSCVARWDFHYATTRLLGKRCACRRPKRSVTRTLADSLIVGLGFPVTIGHMKKTIFTSEAPSAIGPYSQGMRSGRFLFCSGQIPLDPKSGEIVSGDIATQTRRVLENIGGFLRAEGLTFDHIVKTTIFLTDLGDFQTVNEIYGSYFKQDPPARSTV